MSFITERILVRALCYSFNDAHQRGRPVMVRSSGEYGIVIGHNTSRAESLVFLVPKNREIVRHIASVDDKDLRDVQPHETANTQLALWKDITTKMTCYQMFTKEFE